MTNTEIQVEAGIIAGKAGCYLGKVHQLLYEAAIEPGAHTQQQLEIIDGALESIRTTHEWMRLIIQTMTPQETATKDQNANSN